MRFKIKRQERNNDDIYQTASNIRVVTWNVQRMSLGTVNKVKARAAAEIARKHNFDIVLLSEIRADGEGIEYLGSEEQQVIIVHSTKAGIMLRGKMLQEWREGGRIKWIGERCVSVKISGVGYTATYQPVSYHNNQDMIELAKEELKEHTDWTKKDEILVVGGDFNAHIGMKEEGRESVCGKFGLRKTNLQGSELLSFCEVNNLSYCNSFYSHKNRGTWFNNMNRQWYELDGFLMRKNQRHR